MKIHKQTINSISIIGITSSLVGLLQLSVNTTIAILLLVLGLAIDLFDGVLARKFCLTSRTGAWLDTCNDILLYLVAPYFGIMYFWSSDIYALNVVYILLVFAGMFRLVRHSTKGFDDSQKYISYVGLPVYYNFLIPLSSKYFSSLITIILLCVIACLQVSQLPFKKLSIRDSMIAIFCVVVLILI